jgi:hypothetical protein
MAIMFVVRSTSEARHLTIRSASVLCIARGESKSFRSIVRKTETSFLPGCRPHPGRHRRGTVNTLPHRNTLVCLAILVGHTDSIEDDGTPANLFWMRRSCNVRCAEIGRLTKQFNPAYDAMTVADAVRAATAWCTMFVSDSTSWDSKSGHVWFLRMVIEPQVKHYGD